MAVFELSDAYRMERKRSSTYLKHIECLLSAAEEDLVSEDGDLISLKGMRKLKDKIRRIKEI